jgi:hypothetical protein
MTAGNRMIEKARVLATSLTNTARAILANLGSLGDDDTGEQGDVANDQPVYTHPVFCRPLGRVKEEDATALNPAGVCEVIMIRSADEVYPVGYRDLRLSPLVFPIEGEVGIVGYQGGFISLRPNADGDGTNFLLYGARKGSGGEVEAASSIAIDTTSAQKQILLQHEDGATLVLNKDGGVVMANAANDAYVEVKPPGVTINGAEIVLTGGVVMGNSDPAATQFVALANLVLSELQAIQAQLTTHTHSAVTPGTGTSGPSSSTYAAGPVAATLVKAI